MQTTLMKSLFLGISSLVFSAAAQAEIEVFVNVTWDGETPQMFHVEAMQELQKDYPSLVINHFLSPIYFITNDQPAKAAIDSVIKNKQHVGALIGGWKEVVQQAQVIFRSSPSLYGRNPKKEGCQALCGSDVPVTVYSGAELSKIIDTTRQTLEANGYKPLRAMKTVGWQMSDHLASSAIQSGFSIDFSAVPRTLLRGELEMLPIMSWIRQSWKDKEPLFSWFRIGPKPHLVEAGSPLADLDYVSTKELNSLVVKAWERRQSEQIVLNLSLNIQTFKYQMPKLRSVLLKLKDLKGDPTWHPPYLSLDDMVNRARQLALGLKSPFDRLLTKQFF